MIQKAVRKMMHVALAACLVSGLLSAPARGAPLASGPTLDGFTPDQVTAGSGSFTLTVDGDGFMDGSIIRWGGTDLATDFISSARLTATVSAGQVAYAGLVQITVFNPGPGGGESIILLFTVNNPFPSLDSLTPEAVLFGSPTFTLTASGSGFTDTSVLRWGGMDLATTYISDTQVSAVIDAAKVVSPVLVDLTVFNPQPGGGESPALTFGVNNPQPQLDTLLPDQIQTGSAGFLLRVNGSQFVPGAVIRWDGEDLATNVVSGAQLTANISTSRLVTGKTVLISASNPDPGGGESTFATFTINNPVPQVISLSPNPVIAGGFGYTMTVTGSNFVSNSQILLNSTFDPVTTYVNSTRLTAEIQSQWISLAGSITINVKNYGPGGGVSSPVTLQIDNPVPTLSGLEPAVVPMQSAGFTLTVTGGGFMGNSVVRWNGTALTTTYYTAAQLTAPVPADLVAAAGSAEITVFTPTPGGGSSAKLNFVIEPYWTYLPAVKH